jgi:hypothetical protein
VEQLKPAKDRRSPTTNMTITNLVINMTIYVGMALAAPACPSPGTRLRAVSGRLRAADKLDASTKAVKEANDAGVWTGKLAEWGSRHPRRRNPRLD